MVASITVPVTRGAGKELPRPVVVVASDGDDLDARGAGITASADFTPIAGAISANDVMGGSMEFAFTYADGTAIPAGSLIRILTAIVKIDATAVVSGETSYELQCYSVTQPSAQADNDAWTLASGDLLAYRGAISLGAPVDLGAALYVKSPNIDLDIKLTTSSLWGRLRTLGGFTVPATPPVRQVLLYGLVL
jgi:hypothetical protein